MLSAPETSPIPAMIEHQQAQRAIRRLTRALAQALQLRVEDPAVVLAPYLDQPVTTNNREALQRWVEETLSDLDLPTDSPESLEALCVRLTNTLEEAI